MPPVNRVDYPLPAEECDAEAMLRDMDDFFAGRGPVHTTLRRLADRFELENLPYAVIGGMALYLLGYERQTVVVDILMTPDGLQAFHDRLIGRGYRPAFSGARKTFRDTETGVKV